MEVLIIFALLLIGLVLIIKGGDYFVDGASWLAEASGIPKFVVGATIVSVATTLPEIVVSLVSVKESPEMAIGNAVGSVVFNTGVIMAIALIAQPFIIRRRDYAFKGVNLIAVMALLVAASIVGVDIVNMNEATTGVFGSLGAISLLVLFIFFIVENIYSAKKHAQLAEDEGKPEVTKKIATINLTKLILGAGAIGLGAILLKDNAVKLALLAGVSDEVIGVTILAIGTSLPELVTMIIAIRRHEASLSIGNIIGANTIDIAIILPLSAFISGSQGLPVSNLHLLVTLPVTLLIITVAILPTMFTRKFARWQGITMLVLYVGYFTYNLLTVL